MMPDDWAFVDERVKELKPVVTSRSHYFQLLVDHDKRRKLIGGMPDPGGANSDPNSRLKELVKLAQDDGDRRRKKRG